MKGNRQMHVTIRPIEWRDDHMRVGADVTGHPGRRLRKRNGQLYFDIPAQWAERSVIQDKPTDLHDAILRALVFSAMEAGRPIVVHGNVSRSLLENLHEYQHGLCFATLDIQNDHQESFHVHCKKHVVLVALH